MKVFNIMLFKNLGGIEQAFLDYCEALTLTKNQVIPIICKGAKIQKLLTQKPLFLNPFGRNDPFALLKLKYFILREKPDLILAHTTKDTALARKVSGNIPVVSISHGFNFRHLVGKQHIIAITKHMYEAIIKAGHPSKQISYIPNMVRFTNKLKKPKKITTIGFMGRLEPIKGCDILISALAELKSQGIKIKCIIAGEGSEKEKLIKLINDLNLSDEVKMVGWVLGDQKQKFFDSIDIFCLPSHEETFSIVMLEALANSKLVISSDTTGPKEIIGKSGGAVFFKKLDHIDLVKKIQNALSTEAGTKTTIINGYKIAQTYSIAIIAKKLESTLKKLV